MTIRIPTDVRNAAVVAVTDRTDAGAAAGKVRFYTGAQPASANDAATGTLIAEATLIDPAWNAAASGSRTLKDPAPATATVAGTIGWARILDSNNVTVMDCSCGLSGSGADLILTKTAVAVGETVDISSNVSVTMPAG